MKSFKFTNSGTLSSLESARIEEAVKVEKKNYSWGKMVTVHDGSKTSYPLHPEHQKEISKLRDGDKTSFKDETGRRVHVHREGDKVHLMTKDSGYKPTVVSYKQHFEEEIDHISEISSDSIVNYAIKAGKSKSELEKHVEKGGEYSDIAKKMITRREKGLSRATNKLADRAMKKDYENSSKAKRLTDETEVNELSNELLQRYKQKAGAQVDNPKTPSRIKFKRGLGHLHATAKQMTSGKPMPVKEAPETYSQAPVSPPFVGGKKKEGTVTDKSGAKHTPMSRARHLARFAAFQQQKKTPETK